MEHCSGIGCIQSFALDIEKSMPAWFPVLRSSHDPGFIQLVTVFNILLILVYSLVAMHVLYNVLKYLVRQGRYKEFHMSMFYFLAVLVLGLRISQFLMTLIFYHLKSTRSFEDKIVAVTILSAFVEGTLGIQMLGAFIDLHLMIKHNRIAQDECLERHEIRYEQRAVKKNQRLTKWVTACLAVINVVLYGLYIGARQTNNEEGIQFGVKFYCTLL